VQPTWKDGGMLATGYHAHGTHFLKVAGDGQITRKGYFLPYGGSTSAAHWINRNIVYAADYTRGIGILRHTGRPRESNRHRRILHEKQAAGRGIPPPNK
jgi:hypothetical protein